MVIILLFYLRERYFGRPNIFRTSLIVADLNLNRCIFLPTLCAIAATSRIFLPILCAIAATSLTATTLTPFNTLVPSNDLLRSQTDCLQELKILFYGPNWIG